MPYDYAEFTPHKELDDKLNSLQALPYAARRLWLRSEPELPSFLYKFRSLNSPSRCDAQYCQVDPGSVSSKAVGRLREILVDSVLRLSSPDEYNDPFDAQATIYAGGTTDEKIARIEGILAANQPYLGYRRRLADAERIVSQQEFEGFFERAFRVNRARIGIYSFAGNPLSVLMWSHYASDHTGLCLQFDAAQSLAPLVRAFTVDYAEDFPSIDAVTNLQDGLTASLHTKHVGWNYEWERRIIVPDQAGKFMQFRPEALRGIVFGYRATPAIYEAVQSILDERTRVGAPPVRLWRALPERSKYRLRIEPVA